jgi:ABC-type nitrate/sulfonate/bicarbonate transport system substrate-binding protein
MSSEPIFRIGILRLTDAAPLIVAATRGYFAAEGVEANLSVEPSWANIADKLAYGLLDGAMLVPPLALALQLGLSGTVGPERVIVPAALSLNGNTVTLTERWIAAIGREGPVPPGGLSALETARRFAAVLRRSGEKPHLGVVHTFSTHNLLLRYWLASGGIDPQRDVTFTVVPPAQTREALQSGRIDGFCAGAPWGEVAARAGLGGTAATSYAIWNNGSEKVFAVRQGFAESRPARLQAVLRALLRAAAFCDIPANASVVSELLAEDRHLGLPADIIATSLPGAAARRRPGEVSSPDVSVFFANAANFPWRSHAQWFLRQMARWGYLPVGADLAAAMASTASRGCCGRRRSRSRCSRIALSTAQYSIPLTSASTGAMSATEGSGN